MTRAGASHNRTNNFDTLRTIAALMVLVSHSFPLSGQSDLEPVWRLSREQTSAGAMAVTVFFVISGYLITQSFERHNNASVFVINRALRLVPGLTFVTLFLSFIVGPLLTTLPWSNYFSARETYLFPAINISLVEFRDGLPGVFLGNPYPHAVDGSLWTLQYEVACYALVLLLGICGLLNKYVTLGLFIVFFTLVRYWTGGYYISLGVDFLAGAVLYHWKPPLRSSLALGCGVLLAISFLTVGFRLASATVGAYVVIYLALSSSVRLPRLARWGDFSYGIYIWAFPVQQAVAEALGPKVTWYWDAALSLPVVVIVATLSWHWIEAPALATKRRWASRRIAIEVPAPR